MAENSPNFHSLLNTLPEEVDNPSLLQRRGKTPEAARETLEMWGVDKEQQSAILGGQLDVFGDTLQAQLRLEIVAAEVVIAAGEEPRLHGAVTSAAARVIEEVYPYQEEVYPFRD